MEAEVWFLSKYERATIYLNCNVGSYVSLSCWLWHGASGSWELWMGQVILPNLSRQNASVTTEQTKDILR